MTQHSGSRRLWKLFSWLVLVINCTILTSTGPTLAMDPSPSDPTSQIPFRLPPGFVAERIAAPGLVHYPMFACFDDRGRLLVADSDGSNRSDQDITKNPTYRIQLLQDSDGKGHFDKAITFADKLTYPQGIAWHDGAAFTASAPSLLRLKDTNDDGIADVRQELVTGWPLTGVADELHGPDLGPDGFLYWYCGRFNHEIRTPGGPVLRKGRSPLVLRCRPDGTKVEFVSGAQGNPVKAAFTDEGEPLVCGTWSGGDGDRQDVIIHSVEGGDYPNLDGDYGEQLRTGGVLPPLTRFGVSAACGIMRYRGTSFPAPYRGNLFSAHFNMHKVVRHVIERDGATFRSRDEDFLTSDDPDFHPTDVIEDADGSILVVDTGSWFSHCPTSKVGKSPISGSIYRVRYRDAAAQGDPRGTGLTWARLNSDELSALLKDARPFVRDRAINELVKLGARAIEPLRKVVEKGDDPQARILAIWALLRIEGPKARLAIRNALNDPEMSVRLTATAAIARLRDHEALPRLQELIGSDHPAVRREAAVALGRLKNKAATPALIEAIQSTNDRFLEHSIVLAMIRIADRDGMLVGLSHSSPAVRRGALLALDQMPQGGLTSELLARQLESSDTALQQTALQIIRARPEWARTVVTLLRQWLNSPHLTKPQSASLLEALVALGESSDVRELITTSLQNTSIPVETRLLLLEAIAQTRPDRMPPAWIAGLRQSISHSDDRVVHAAVAILRAAGFANFDDALLNLARDTHRSEILRVEALAAAASRIARLDSPLFNLLISSLQEDRPPLVRLAAAGVLGHVQLDDSQVETVVGSIASAGPLELSRLLPALERCHSESIGTALVTALKRSPGLTSLTPESLRQAFASFPKRIQEQAASLLAQLEISSRDQTEHLKRLSHMLDRGDIDHGREIFFGQKAACTTCHSVKSEGGHVGPDLSKIGAIRTKHDLLEAIVYPSATFARGFEPYTIATADGRSHTGIIARETPEALILVSPDRSEHRLPRLEIEEMKRSTVSIMPQGLDVQLTRQELVDMIAFLNSLK